MVNKLLSFEFFQGGGHFVSLPIWQGFVLTGDLFAGDWCQNANVK